MPEIDKVNRFLVGVQGDQIRVMIPVHNAPLTKAEAINLAAYLVALADPAGEKFPALLRAVKDA
jgi:hypothetical protein